MRDMTEGREKVIYLTDLLMVVARERITVFLLNHCHHCEEEPIAVGHVVPVKAIILTK